ncbi:hypothetical protein DMJ13_06720 [halophilic archaeon]|nr:hypothetical protein DMJ13_06720 [halophilic archaeon]
MEVVLRESEPLLGVERDHLAVRVGRPLVRFLPVLVVVVLVAEMLPEILPQRDRRLLGVEERFEVRRERGRFRRRRLDAFARLLGVELEVLLGVERFRSPAPVGGGTAVLVEVLLLEVLPRVLPDRDARRETVRQTDSSGSCALFVVERCGLVACY